METTSEPGRVQLSAAAASALERHRCFDLGLASRGERMIKGKVGRLFFSSSSYYPVYAYVLWTGSDLHASHGERVIRGKVGDAPALTPPPVASG